MIAGFVTIHGGSEGLSFGNGEDGGGYGGRKEAGVTPRGHKVERRVREEAGNLKSLTEGREEKKTNSDSVYPKNDENTSKKVREKKTYTQLLDDSFSKKEAPSLWQYSNKNKKPVSVRGGRGPRTYLK